MTKQFFLSSTAVVALMIGVPGQAQAQTPYNWTGRYVGFYAGGAWGSSNASTLVDCADGVSDVYICSRSGFGAADAALVNAAGTGKITSSGFTGGLEGGYNWQVRNFVYGLESDFGAFGLRGSRQVSGVIPNNGFFDSGPFMVTHSISTDWLWTLRGRVGVALPNNILPFLTGGLAVTQFRFSSATNFAGNFGFPASSGAGSSAVMAGWTLGGGVEWAFNDHWRVKAEYLYLNFGKLTTAATIVTNPAGYSQGISTSADLTAQLVRVGFNYGF
jgi:outer membrane immunogenic protein